jgi:hypothetical protein
MNGPKVRKTLKAVPVSELTAHKLITRFLQREGQEEIILSEPLTRLQSICQSMGVGIHSEATIPKETRTAETRHETNAMLLSEQGKPKKTDESSTKKSAKKNKKEKKRKKQSPEDDGKKKKRRKHAEDND